MREHFKCEDIEEICHNYVELNRIECVILDRGMIGGSGSSSDTGWWKSVLLTWNKLFSKANLIKRSWLLGRKDVFVVPTKLNMHFPSSKLLLNPVLEITSVDQRLWTPLCTSNSNSSILLYPLLQHTRHANNNFGYPSLSNFPIII